MLRILQRDDDDDYDYDYDDDDDATGTEVCVSTASRESRLLALPSANDLAMATMKTERKRERKKQQT